MGDRSVLTISYTRSGLLDGGRSFVAVVVNDVNVGGHLLQGGFHSPATFSLTIPATVLHADGFNHVQLNFDLRDHLSAATGCGSTDPALSATVYGTSQLRYDVRRLALPTFAPDLAALPAPFAPPGASAPPGVIIGLPGSPSATELTAAGWILARFGADAQNAQPSISTTSAASLSARSGLVRGSNILLMGTATDNPAIGWISTSAPIHVRGGLWRDSADRPLSPSEGVILEARSPWNPARAVLIASGNGYEGVRRAGLVLASTSLRRMLHGNYAVLTSTPSAPLPPSIGGTATLSDLGYTSITLEGSGEQSWHLTFDLQGSPVRAGEFDLMFGHGALPADGAATVRADLNDQPIASRSLAVTDPERVKWRVPLPIDALKPGTNVLNIRFFLSPAQPSCQTTPNPGSWAVIDPSSTLISPGTDGTNIPDLSRLPNPLLVDGDPSSTIVVLPDSLASDPGGLAIAAFLGAQARVDVPAFLVATASQVTPSMLHGRAVILDGLLGTNRLIDQIQSHLPLQTMADLQVLGTADTAVQATAHAGGRFGLVEEFTSPWDASQLAVLVSGSSPALLPAARQALSSGSLSGTVALVDAAGNTHSIATGVQQEAPRSLSAGSSSRPIRAVAFMGVALLLLQVLFAAGRNANKKGSGS